MKAITERGVMLGAKSLRTLLIDEMNPLWLDGDMLSQANM